MTARKPKAVPDAQVVGDAADFDVAGFITGFAPAVVAVRLYRRGDLLPKLALLEDRYAKLQELEQGEKSFADGDPLAAVVEEINAVGAEYEAGGYDTFTFRPQVKKLHDAVVAKWKATGRSDDEEWLTWMLMAASCVSHPGITPEAFAELRDRIGEGAMRPLVNGFVAGYSGGGDPTAPFLPKHLPAQSGDSSFND